MAQLPQENPRPAAVMIVDDEPDIVFIFQKSLEQAGHVAFGFTDPLLALEALKDSSMNYGLIITDIRMPKMDGIEFASKARAISPRVFLAMMSAYGVKDLDIPADLKVSELIQKPVTPSQLKQLVIRYLDRSARAETG